MKYVLAILNSSVAAFYISKKFNSVKLLRSHIEQMPIPVVSEEIQESIVKKVDRIMNSSENISGLYEDLDSDIMQLFGLSEKHRDIIKKSLCGKYTAHYGRAFFPAAETEEYRPGTACQFQLSFPLDHQRNRHFFLGLPFPRSHQSRQKAVAFHRSFCGGNRRKMRFLQCFPFC